CLLIFLLTCLRSPRSRLFPYTTLFRSVVAVLACLQHLNAEVARLGDVDFSALRFRVEGFDEELAECNEVSWEGRDEGRSAEDAEAAPGRPRCREEPPGAVELADAVVVKLGDIDVVGKVDRHIGDTRGGGKLQEQDTVR